MRGDGRPEPRDGRELAVGVIGTGRMGAAHARNLHSQVVGARLAAVSDADEGRARAVAERCGGAEVFADPDALVRDDGVEAVVISSPDPTHAPLALECVRRGKPVLCEKPLATGADEALEVVRAETETGRRLVRVGFMRRDDARHRRVKRAVDDGRVGRPLLFRGVHRNAEPGPGMSSGAAIVRNAAVHDLDAARWMLGQEISAVHALGAATDPESGVLDLILLHLSFDGGAVATIEVFVSARYGYEVAVEVVGEEGTVSTAPHEAPVVRRGGEVSQESDADWLARFEAAYVEEMRAWVADVRSGRSNGPTAWDGYLSLVAADACARSLGTGRAEKVRSVRRPALYGSPDGVEDEAVPSAGERDGRGAR